MGNFAFLLASACNADRLVRPWMTGAAIRRSSQHAIQGSNTLTSPAGFIRLIDLGWLTDMNGRAD
jgi:hypothetical protein